MNQSMTCTGMISVIMPVYNAEKTLEQTVRSILSQPYENLELILVEDGSKDNSLALCRRLAREDARVRVITQKNAGPAVARNKGLEAMQGEYVMFVDSDDLLSPNACDTMVRALGNKELVIAHYYFCIGSAESDRGLLKGNRNLSEREFLEALVKRPGSFYFSALWNKLYRADVIRDQTIRFDPFLFWGEDYAFNMQYYHNVHNGISLVSDPVYHYIKNPGSTSIRTLIHIVHSCRIKWRLFQHFKALYVEKGLYTNHRFQIWWYLFNVTLAD